MYAVHAQQELRSILHCAGMALDKWVANNQQLLSDTSASSSEHTFEPEYTVATLGLRWSPFADEFSYNVHPPEYTNGITKWVIVFEAARLYDPLGLASAHRDKGEDFDSTPLNHRKRLGCDCRRRTSASMDQLPKVAATSEGDKNFTLAGDHPHVVV